MSTYLSLTESEYLELSESEYLELGEGIGGVNTGYLDTFSMIFGWWSSTPTAYTYYNLGNFSITRSNTNNHYITRISSNTNYITRTHNKTYHIHPTGPL